MTRTLTTLAVLLALGTGTAFAAQVKEGDALGTKEAEISAALAAAGYKVEKIEEERGKLEAKASYDGAKFEIYVSPETGLVTRVKSDD